MCVCVCELDIRTQSTVNVYERKVIEDRGNEVE